MLYKVIWIVLMLFYRLLKGVGRGVRWLSLCFS